MYICILISLHETYLYYRVTAGWLYHRKQIGTWRTFNKTLLHSIPFRLDGGQQQAVGADLFIAAPVDTIGDKFKENVNVMVQNIAGQNVDIRRYVCI